MGRPLEGGRTWQGMLGREKNCDERIRREDDGKGKKREGEKKCEDMANRGEC